MIYFLIMFNIYIDTSTTHSPRFDWVVAHVGNSYPQTIVSQVLNLGFQHFNLTSSIASIKLNSVQAILEHLVIGHAREVQITFEQITHVSKAIEN